jgi:hypothetical protein
MVVTSPVYSQSNDESPKQPKNVSKFGLGLGGGMGSEAISSEIAVSSYFSVNDSVVVKGIFGHTNTSYKDDSIGVRVFKV